MAKEKKDKKSCPTQTKSAEKEKNAGSTAKKVPGRPFLSGENWNGNRLGRPKGSRNQLNEAFIAALCEDFNAHGKEVIATVRADKPDVYMRVVASLQPKEIDIRDKTLDDLTDEEVFDALAAIRSLKNETLSQKKSQKGTPH